MLEEGFNWLKGLRQRLDPRVEGSVRGGQMLSPEPIPSGRLRLTSFNMQAGMAMTHYSHYLTRSWRHVFPPQTATRTLEPMAALLRHSDLVAIQEVDAGSLRSGFINQLSHLAQEAGFSYAYQQVNRDLGHLGQYANGLLARWRPAQVEQHQLPGLRGRGAIMARFQMAGQDIVIVNMHLALTGRGRWHQLAYMRSLLDERVPTVLMGDLNCSHAELLESPLGDMAWQWTYGPLDTYPSWRPVRRLDHILVSRHFRIERVDVPDLRLSDHRPVCMELEFPSTTLANLHAGA